MKTLNDLTNEYRQKVTESDDRFDVATGELEKAYETEKARIRADFNTKKQELLNSFDTVYFVCNDTHAPLEIFGEYANGEKHLIYLNPLEHYNTYGGRLTVTAYILNGFLDLIDTNTVVIDSVYSAVGKRLKL